MWVCGGWVSEGEVGLWVGEDDVGLWVGKADVGDLWWQAGLAREEYLVC